MTDYCEKCEHKCSLAFMINFCKDCKNYKDCDILAQCDDGHDIECNNGFEPKE
jgi:hypothetical protein